MLGRYNAIARRMPPVFAGSCRGAALCPLNGGLLHPRYLYSAAMSDWANPLWGSWFAGAATSESTDMAQRPSDAAATHDAIDEDLALLLPEVYRQLQRVARNHLRRHRGGQYAQHHGNVALAAGRLSLMGCALAGMGAAEQGRWRNR